MAANSTRLRTSGGYNYPKAPRDQVLAMAKLLDGPADILDIGAGFGNNCIPLLKAGHRVTATETNQECLTQLRRLSKQYPGQLVVLKEPAELLATKRQFDVVICTMVLHFLTPKQALRTLKTMQTITRPTGYNVVTNYLFTEELLPSYTWMLKKDELRSLYADWKITAYEESHPYGLRNVRTARQLARWLLGRKGYKAARLIAQK